MFFKGHAFGIYSKEPSSTITQTFISYLWKYGSFYFFGHKNGKKPGISRLEVSHGGDVQRTHTSQYFSIILFISTSFLNKERIPEWVAIPFFRGSSLTQGLNPGFLHYRQILYHLSHQGSQIRQNYITKSITYTLYLHFGEGNGNPLQCSCLENPRDGGAWWAAVYGVAQSQTRLKRLSSSSSILTFGNL